MSSETMKVMSYTRPECPVCNKCVKQEVTLTVGDKVGFISQTGGGQKFTFSAREGVLISIGDTEVSLIYRKRLIRAPKKSVTSLNGFNALTVSLLGVCEC